MNSKSCHSEVGPYRSKLDPCHPELYKANRRVTDDACEPVCVRAKRVAVSGSNQVKNTASNFKLNNHTKLIE